MGRILLFVAAALLAATAAIHAAGQPMVDGWLGDLPHQQKAAICLMWMTDSIDWTVVALLWALTGWKQRGGWLGAAAVATLIPLAGGVGVMRIDHTFFGGWMILGSVTLAILGLILSWRTQAAP